MGGGNVCISAVCKSESAFIRPFRFWTKIHEIVIPNGINLDRIDKKKVTTPHSPFAFLAFGGRNVQKRTDLLVKAAQRLNDRGLKLQVKIIGTDKVREDIEALCGPIPDYVDIIRPCEDINSIFEQADCFVSTSVHETFSYAIAEAAYYGLPVIQSDIVGTEWNRNNPAAYIFKSMSVHDLCDKMETVMQEKIDVLRENCRKSQEFILSNYSIDSWVLKMTDFFESIPE